MGGATGLGRPTGLALARLGCSVAVNYIAATKDRESRASFAGASLVGRVCQPEDVAAAILSLITGSDMVTGQTLVCDGGALLADPASHGLRNR